MWHALDFIRAELLIDNAPDHVVALQYNKEESICVVDQTYLHSGSCFSEGRGRGWQTANFNGQRILPDFEHLARCFPLLFMFDQSSDFQFVQNKYKGQSYTA